MTSEYPNLQGPELRALLDARAGSTGNLLRITTGAPESGTYLERWTDCTNDRWVFQNELEGRDTRGQRGEHLAE